MEKLYKSILFFVGLIAMNISVQAQLGSYSSYFFVGAHASTKSLIYSPVSTKSVNLYNDGKDWAGISSLYKVKEVTNFTNFPNPATTQTTIAYTLTTKASVNLRVIDLAGKQLTVLVKQEQAAGKQEYYLEFSKNNITSGMYILVLQVDNKIFSRKIIVQ
jgi:hypothetical protein